MAACQNPTVGALAIWFEVDFVFGYSLYAEGPGTPMMEFGASGHYIWVLGPSGRAGSWVREFVSHCQKLWCHTKLFTHREMKLQRKAWLMWKSSSGSMLDAPRSHHRPRGVQRFQPVSWWAVSGCQKPIKSPTARARTQPKPGQ